MNSYERLLYKQKMPPILFQEIRYLSSGLKSIVAINQEGNQKNTHHRLVVAERHGKRGEKRNVFYEW